MKEATETITISVPTNLLQMLDIAASEFGYTRSKFVSNAIRDKVLSSFYKNSSTIRDEFYSSILKTFQTKNV